MKIQRISYYKVDGVLVPRFKHVLESIDDNYCLVSTYRVNRLQTTQEIKHNSFFSNFFN